MKFSPATAKPICAAGTKLKVLVAKFGERGFDYAGNSSADLAVWRGAREAIVVNASRAIVDQAANCTKLGPTFVENYSAFFPAKSFLNELFIRSRYLAAIGAGLLLACAFTKPGVAGSAWIAPALMLACASDKSGGDSFRIGYVAGFSFWLASLYWLLLCPWPDFQFSAGSRSPPTSRSFPPSGSGFSRDKLAKAAGRGEPYGRSQARQSGSRWK